MLYRSILTLLIIAMLPRTFTEGALHPTASINKEMTCEEFEKPARFNPYSVLDVIWFVFYHWGGKHTRTEYQFLYPTAKEKAYIKRKVENATVPVDWSARMIIMKDVSKRLSSLLVEKGDKGEFWLYAFQAAVPKGQKMEPLSVRMKQTANNKYIAYMDCEHHVVLAMSRISEIPRKKWIQDAAAQIGYRGRGGVSYLYQGHHWGPMPEADEKEYWVHPDIHKRRLELLDKIAKSKPDNAQVDTTIPPLFPNRPV